MGSSKEIDHLTEVSRRMPKTTENQDQTKDIKVENCIGFAQVPVGIAGPLTIQGESQTGTVYAALATYEATLVASCSRGCKAVQSTGGVKAAALSEGMYRAPVFIFKDVGDAVRFSRYLPELFTSFSESSERTSKHVKLLGVVPFIIGTSVHTRFRYSCGDAAGQNMVSIASHRACKDFLESEKSAGLNIVDFLVEGQFASDKKLSMGHITVPRGTEVMVWATITDEVARTVLGNSTKRLHEVFLLTTHACIRNGVQGNNVNTANILAAFFIAAGQDPASVGESSWSHLTTELDDDSGDLTFSLYFPSLPVGTVGGGTGYPTQREALDLIGCRGTGRKWALAETVASFALALDISTLSAVCNDTFAQSHHRLARGGPTRANVGLTPLARL